MSSEKKTKPQLHSSHLNMLWRCGEQFRRVVLEGDKEPPAFPMLVGSNVHEVAKRSLEYKVERGGELMPTEQVLDLARDNFLKVWNDNPIVLTKEERERGLETVKGEGIDLSVDLARVYQAELAPRINPRPGGVERKFVIECEGFPFNIAGAMDVHEENTELRDLKFRVSKMVSQNEVDTSEQLTVYSLAAYILDGVIPAKVWLDGVARTDGCAPRFKSVEGVRTVSDFISFRNRFERAVEVIEKEAFTPTSRSNWWCSERFCGFAADGSCPFFNKGRMTVYPSTKKEEHRHARRKETIPAGSERWLDAVR